MFIKNWRNPIWSETFYLVIKLYLEHHYEYWEKKGINRSSDTFWKFKFFLFEN